jgi:hypothetical protein
MYVPKGVPKRSKNPLPKTKSPVKQANPRLRIDQKGCKNGPQKRNQNCTLKSTLKSHPSAQMTSSSILQFTTISNTSSILWLSAIFANFFKIEDEVKGEQGLAALALVNFAEVYEIEGGS